MTDNPPEALALESWSRYAFNYLGDGIELVTSPLSSMNSRTTRFNATSTCKLGLSSGRFDAVPESAEAEAVPALLAGALLDSAAEDGIFGETDKLGDERAKSLVTAKILFQEVGHAIFAGA